MIVWGIEYTIRINDKWAKDWTDPIGIYAMSFCNKLGDAALGFIKRPIFFATQRSALAEIQRIMKEEKDNSIKYRTAKFNLTWKRV